MKKSVIAFISCVLVVMMFFAFSTTVYASNFNVSDHETASQNKFGLVGAKVTGVILNTMRYVGAGIASIALVIIAIKYLYASPGEKADYKKNLVVYVIGGLGLFSVGTILKIIEEFSKKIG